jgi:hypothetical protein
MPYILSDTPSSDVARDFIKSELCYQYEFLNQINVERFENLHLYDS